MCSKQLGTTDMPDSFGRLLRGLSAGCAWLPVSHISRFRSQCEDALRLRWSRQIRRICRFQSRGEHTQRGARRYKQVRYSLASGRILTLRRDSLRGSAMPILLVATRTDASRASEKRIEHAKTRYSPLHPISSRNPDAVSTCAGPPNQYGVRRYHRPTPRMFRSRIRPSPAGEDRRQCLSVSREGLNNPISEGTRWVAV